MKKEVFKVILYVGIFFTSIIFVVLLNSGKGRDEENRMFNPLREVKFFAGEVGRTGTVVAIDTSTVGIRRYIVQYDDDTAIKVSCFNFEKNLKYSQRVMIKRYYYPTSKNGPDEIITVAIGK